MVLAKRLLRWLALGIGYPIAIGLILAVIVIGIRWIQVRFFYSPVPAEHAEEKAAYLASLPRVDPAGAPNFVVIFFDDLGYGDLSSYGNRMIATPRIDRAAAEGVRMNHFYSASPVCTPSRAALLTGRYPVRSGITQHVFFPADSPFGTLRLMLGARNELPADEITVAEALAAAGYATGMVGKWHLGGTPGHQPNDFGFQTYYGVLWSNDMQPLHIYRDREIEERDTTDVQPFRAYRHEDAEIENRGVDQSRLTELYTREAIAFLERHRDGPFFLYLSHTFPHVPLFASPEHAGESEGGLYGDVVEDLDRSTGAVLDALARLGLERDTLVLITSDNGADYNGSAGGLRGRKQETYEGGQRVPMIALWPERIPAGVVTGAMAMTIGEEPDAVRDARFKYLRSTGDEGRDRPHLSDVADDAEAHDLHRKHPEAARRLADALDAMQRGVAENPRGWR
jgi:arylsulfatase A-like enzyme